MNLVNKVGNVYTAVLSDTNRSVSSVFICLFICFLVCDMNQFYDKMLMSPEKDD